MNLTKKSTRKARFYLCTLLVLLVGVVYAQSPKTAPKSRPNIIVFLIDDMGWQDTSLPFWTKPTAFNKRYHTPNMERLAKEGMQFTNAYATPGLHTYTGQLAHGNEYHKSQDYQLDFAN